MPELADLSEPLADGPVSLRRYAERDIPEILIAYQDDPDMHERLGEARPPSGAELGRAAEHAEAQRQAGRSLELTIVERAHDACRGQVRVSEIEWEAGRAKLDVWVAPRFRGQGFAHTALRLAREWLSSSCGLSAHSVCEAGEQR